MITADSKSSFIAYKFQSDSQYFEACKLTLDQKAVVQNLISAAAEEKLALVFDTTNPQEFIQQNASLAGQIDILKHLLALSEAAELRTAQLNAAEYD